MKVTFIPAQEPKKKEKPFPKYMMSPSNGLIVHFSEPGKGMVVDPGRSNNDKEFYCDYWDMDTFSDMPEGSKLVIEF